MKRSAIRELQAPSRGVPSGRRFPTPGREPGPPAALSVLKANLGVWRQARRLVLPTCDSHARFPSLWVADYPLGMDAPHTHERFTELARQYRMAAQQPLSVVIQKQLYALDREAGERLLRVLRAGQLSVKSGFVEWVDDELVRKAKVRDIPHHRRSHDFDVMAGFLDPYCSCLHHYCQTHLTSIVTQHVKELTALDTRGMDEAQVRVVWVERAHALAACCEAIASRLISGNPAHVTPTVVATSKNENSIGADPPSQGTPVRPPGQWSRPTTLKELAEFFKCGATARELRPQLQAIGSDLFKWMHKNYFVRLDTVAPEHRDDFVAHLDFVDDCRDAAAKARKEKKAAP